LIEVLGETHSYRPLHQQPEFAIGTPALTQCRI
jgi:hypothetical protein